MAKNIFLLVHIVILVLSQGLNSYWPVEKKKEGRDGVKEGRKEGKKEGSLICVRREFPSNFSNDALDNFAMWE